MIVTLVCKIWIVVMGDANVIDRVSLAVGVRLWNVMRQERDVSCENDIL